VSTKNVGCTLCGPSPTGFACDPTGFSPDEVHELSPLNARLQVGHLAREGNEPVLPPLGTWPPLEYNIEAVDVQDEVRVLNQCLLEPHASRAPQPTLPVIQALPYDICIVLRGNVKSYRYSGSTIRLQLWPKAATQLMIPPGGK
jgi:hypothetical protein